MTIPPFESAPIDAGPSEPSPSEEASGPAEQKILKAMDFYQQALRMGPRQPREVLAEGKALGHTKRTQERARVRLHVQKIPPERWQGPWMIALLDDPAVEEARKRRKEKARKRQQRKGNGRKRRKRRDRGSSSSHVTLLVAAR
jgi:hypothetical protein